MRRETEVLGEELTLCSSAPAATSYVSPKTMNLLPDRSENARQAPKALCTAATRSTPRWNFGRRELV